MYIVYEGPDRVGKTTTRAKVHEIRKQKDNALDRFIGSMIVYGKVFGRYSSEDVLEQYNDERKFIQEFDPVLIYLYAPAGVIIDRMIKDNHPAIKRELIEKELEEYDLYFERSDIRHKLKIDTSENNQEQVVFGILQFLEQIEENKEKNIILSRTLKDLDFKFDNFSNRVKDTLELNNVYFSFYEFDHPINEVPESDTKERFWILENIDTAIKKLQENIYTREAIIYNLYKDKLEHNCLSTLNLYYRDNMLNLNVYARSMNYEKNFSFDMKTFEMVRDKAATTLGVKKGMINVFIMSLHKFIK